MIKKDGMSIEDMLRSGVSADELKARLQNEIDAAKENIAASAQRDIDSVRRNLAQALYDYILALDVMDLDPEEADDIIDTLTEALEEIEAEVIKLVKVMKILYGDDLEAMLNTDKKKDKKNNLDKELKSLLKGLGIRG